MGHMVKFSRNKKAINPWHASHRANDRMPSEAKKQRDKTPAKDSPQCSGLYNQPMPNRSFRTGPGSPAYQTSRRFGEH